jgi:GT2 family glycosyltransferase
MGQVTDIILTTRNRPELLAKTLERLYVATTSPYSLHVLDDASDAGNVQFILNEWEAGRVHHVLLRGERCGIMANSNVGAWMAFSDPVVFVDDDVLCPIIEPDWLARGLAAMDERPKLGLLALNHPGARRRSYEQDDTVTYCKYVGATFMFVRRAFLNQYSLPHYRENFGHVTTQFRSQQARRNGWTIGYLTETFCYHMGHTSANGSEYKGHFIDPLDWETLRPPDRWIWQPETG